EPQYVLDHAHVHRRRGHRLSGQKPGAYVPAVESCATLQTLQNPLGHDPGPVGHVPGIGGHVAGPAGHDRPEYADKTSFAAAAKKHKVSEQTLYAWRKHFGELQPTDVKRLKALETENAKLKKLLAERV